MEGTSFSKNEKYFLIEFYLQLFWILLAMVCVNCNPLYDTALIFLCIVPFPISILLNVILILSIFPGIAIFNVLFSAAEIVFSVVLIKTLYRKLPRKAYIICNLFFSSVLVGYLFTYFSTNEIQIFTIIWAIVLFLGIIIAIYSNLVNSKFQEKENKITIDNAWND